MKPSPTKFSLSLIPVITILAVSGALFCIEILPWHLGEISSSPSTSLQEVLGQPMPDGISGLKIISRQYLIKRWFWMRFQADDGALAVLTRQAERITDPSEVAIALGGKRGVANHRFDSRDLIAVGWQQVWRISKSEIYKVSSYSDGFFWISYLIVNRKHHLIYVNGSGD